MQRLLILAAAALIAGAAQAQLPGLGELIKGAGSLSRSSSAPGADVDDKTAGAGIKEALAVGAENAVKSLSATNGYLSNQAVKILMPASVQKVAEVARVAGFQKQVDDFIVSMNRAAEAAVPLAVKFFGDAIRDMSLEDVRAILTGGDTAATEFFRRKTSDKLYAAFKPIVTQKVDEVGATKAYKDMIGRYENVPFVGRQSIDLDDYVTDKALAGVFLMVGEEEKKIRTNPAARGSDLLKAVFGK